MPCKLKPPEKNHPFIRVVSINSEVVLCDTVSLSQFFVTGVPTSVVIESELATPCSLQVCKQSSVLLR